MKSKKKEIKLKNEKSGEFDEKKLEKKIEIHAEIQKSKKGVKFQSQDPSKFTSLNLKRNYVVIQILNWRI